MEISENRFVLCRRKVGAAEKVGRDFWKLGFKCTDGATKRLSITQLVFRTISGKCIDLQVLKNQFSFYKEHPELFPDLVQRYVFLAYIILFNSNLSKHDVLLYYIHFVLFRPQILES